MVSPNVTTRPVTGLCLRLDFTLCQSPLEDTHRFGHAFVERGEVQKSHSLDESLVIHFLWEGQGNVVKSDLSASGGLGFFDGGNHLGRRNGFSAQIEH